MRNKILKFRAWDGLNKKFTYWTMNDLCTYAEKDEKPNALDEWQQDTGLLDRHGKEIYGGDIVKMMKDPIVPQYAICKVEWRDKYAGFNFSRIKLVNIENPGEGWSPSTNNFWEIIGNTYETPELLEKTPLL